MLYEASKLNVVLSDGIAVLKFDAQDDSVNKFDRATVEQLGEATDALKKAEGLKGLLVTSGKGVFIVGADITEFGAQFKAPDEEIMEWMQSSNAVFNAIEDLGVPSVTAINGIALGGGLEMCLATDYRVMSEKAQIGLPETKLGIIPGFGGTVRLPRLIGADNAIEWIAGGGQQRPDKAFKVGAVDAVVAADDLEKAARDLLQKAIDGEFDWQARNTLKKAPLKLNHVEAMMVFETSKGFVMQQSKGQYPAPIQAVKCIQAAAGKSRDEALLEEHKGFIKLAKTPEADALIGLFLNDQLIKKKNKRYGKIAREVNQAAVLGAGIMGGGIAYQSALKKVPTLSYGDFKQVDVVVEAVVENPKVKKSVLAETEDAVGENAILASNTSSISIDELAKGLKRPESFLGMHFFNPVHAMPLVEVIKGEKSSEEAIATIVNYATTLGKTPIVVNNCPGFLVNRILFPYFFGFQALVSDGANFEKIDKTMEKFGWPMGPAYLSDVVGMDTSQHVGEVLAEGYPDRMSPEGESSLDVMVDAGRYGQKTGSGYYKYEKDKKGKPKKQHDDAAHELVAKVQSGGSKEFDEQEIVDRMMLPLVIEAARCLEEGIAESPNEVDMGLILGVGFPPFRGGALKYADRLGLDVVCEKADQYASLGKLYEPTDKMREMASNNEKYYS